MMKIRDYRYEWATALGLHVMIYMSTGWVCGRAILPVGGVFAA
jgi:hypothetical protein